MDSFSKVSKQEILEQQLDATKSGIPFLFGLFSCSGSMDEDGNLQITSDIKQLHDFICKTCKAIIKNYKKINVGSFVPFFDNLLLEPSNLQAIITLSTEYKINKKEFYITTFKNNLLRLIFDLKNLDEEKTITENFEKITNTIDEIKGLAKGLYIGCATSSIKISEKANEKTTSGYHLEFASKDMPLLREFSHIIAQFDIYAKLIQRTTNYVLYLKDADHVSDMLALVGANNSVLLLKNEMAKREFRNKINRQTNCLSANISKTVDASLKQLQAIQKIDKKIGIETLPPDLEEVALMRLANPEEPLSVLLQLSDLNLTKSGLNHRLRKIISIAERL